jgi:hypothetical protein
MVATVTPASVLQKALERGWGPVLVQRALAAGFTPECIDRALKMGISLRQAEQMIARQELAQAGKVYTPAQEEYIDNVRRGRYHLEWLNDARPARGSRRSGATPSAASR